MSTRPGGLLLADALAELGSSRRSPPARVSLPLLRRVPLFADLSDRQLRKVARLATVARFRPGAAIIRQGSRGDAFYVLLEGEATVTRRGRSNATLAAGDHLGEMALLDRRPRSATVTTASETTALRVSASQFSKLLRTDPSIVLALLRTLSARVRDLEDSLS